VVETPFFQRECGGKCTVTKTKTYPLLPPNPIYNVKVVAAGDSADAVVVDAGDDDGCVLLLWLA